MRNCVEAKFWRFHNANPHIYDLVLKCTLEAKRSRFKNFGIAAIFERIRWYVDVETDNEEPFKLSNDHKSRYARLIMIENPELYGFFKTKPLTTWTSLKLRTPIKKKRKRKRTPVPIREI